MNGFNPKETEKGYWSLEPTAMIYDKSSVL